MGEANEGQLSGSVNCDKEIELTFGGLHLGDIDMAGADGVALEALPFRFVAIHVRQARYPVALKATMQGRACQMRKIWLQSIEAVIQWQQRMPPEGHDHRFLLPA
ncbi:hypothetical protein CG51_10520 [Haematobacter missouriensis]|nr:hypothetical protein CG51_10520 [Haematobacter missouriensis]